MQAGSHPDVTIFQHAVPVVDATDDVKDTFVRLAPGLLGNPQNAALCTRDDAALSTRAARRGEGRDRAA